MASNRDLNELMAEVLLGTAKPDEEAELKAKADVAAECEAIVEADDLVSRYAAYRQANEHRQEAAKALKARLARREAPGLQSQRNVFWQRFRVPLRVAAAVALVLTAGAAWWWHQYTAVVPPVISEHVQRAIQQSREAGRVSAEVVLWDQDEMTAAKAGQADGRAVSTPGDGGGRFAFNVPESVEPLLEAYRITTHADKEFWLTLDDGSLVHLNYNTRLVYPEKFVGSTRDVVLDGEAYFMVARDRRHPFVVHTPQGSISVYGTEFNVRTGSGGTEDGRELEVVLVKGSVGLTPVNGEELLMQPGQMASVATGNTKPSVSQVDTEPYVAWNTGKFVFQSCPLEQLMLVLSHWYGYEVQFQNDKARDIEFTGSIDRYRSVKPALGAIRFATGLDIEERDKTIIIKN